MDSFKTMIASSTFAHDLGIDALLKDELVGAIKKREGYTASIPIILVPGFVSSTLKCTKTYNVEYLNRTVWCSMGYTCTSNSNNN